MDDLGTFERNGENVDLRYERHYPRPVETVWAALTDPARLVDWIGPALVEPHVGGRYELFTNRPRPMTGRILAWDPPRVLEFSWDTGDAPESVVRCELSPEGQGARLVFTHRGVGFNWVALVLPGWHDCLHGLGSLLDGQRQPPSMPRWREFQAVYVDRYKLTGVQLDPPPGHGD